MSELAQKPSVADGKSLLKCKFQDGYFICEHCKISVPESKQTDFLKHIWLDLHPSRRCNHGAGNSTSNLPKSCHLIKHTMLQLLAQAKGKKKHTTPHSLQATDLNKTEPLTARPSSTSIPLQPDTHGYANNATQLTESTALQPPCRPDHQKSINIDKDHGPRSSEKLPSTTTSLDSGHSSHRPKEKACITESASPQGASVNSSFDHQRTMDIEKENCLRYSDTLPSTSIPDPSQADRVDHQITESRRIQCSSDNRQTQDFDLEINKKHGSCTTESVAGVTCPEEQADNLESSTQKEMLSEETPQISKPSLSQSSSDDRQTQDCDREINKRRGSCTQEPATEVRCPEEQTDNLESSIQKKTLSKETPQSSKPSLSQISNTQKESTPQNLPDLSSSQIEHTPSSSEADHALDSSIEVNDKTATSGSASSLTSGLRQSPSVPECDPEDVNVNSSELPDSLGFTVSDFDILEGRDEYETTHMEQLKSKDVPVEPDENCNCIKTKTSSLKVGVVVEKAAQSMVDKSTGTDSPSNSVESMVKPFKIAKDKVDKIGRHRTKERKKEQKRIECGPVVVRQYEINEQCKSQVEEALKELEKEGIEQWDEERRCAICFYSSTVKMSLQWHMESHLQPLDEGFKCPFCLFTSKVERMVRNHQKQHSRSTLSPEEERDRTVDNAHSHPPEHRVSIETRNTGGVVRGPQYGPFSSILLEEFGPY